jgi:N-acetylmuramoyl-L-alanine amidase
VALSVDGVSFGNATYGASRPDVCGTYPDRAGCPNVGWTGSIDTTLLADGQHTLGVTATTAAGQSSTYSKVFSVANAAANTVHVGVDSPQTSNGSISGAFTANGWALSSDSTISSVTVKVDGTVLGTATYGAARGDVCSVFGSVGGCPNVGWTYSLDLTQFAPGTHTFEATATSASGKNGSFATSFTVAASPSPIVVDIDRPGSTGSHFLGAATFSGWVGSSAGPINSVAISIDGVPAGAATYGTARPDVCAGSPYVNCPNVGWTFDVDTTKLTVGSHTLQVLATSGSQRHATSTNFIVENWTQPSAVLINVDNPAPNGGPLGGSTIFNGWIISDDGGVASVSIAIDGVPYGNATYGTFRPDVCAAYQRSGSCNYGWTFPVDTSTLNDGTHTLSVTMTNTGGKSTTATRTFSVQNYFQ